MPSTTVHAKSEPAACTADRRIAADTSPRLRRLTAHPQEIRRRLKALDAECDTDQVLKANAATIALSGLAAGSAIDLRSLILPAMVAASLVQYVLTGRCPPLPILRDMGFRTRAEIDAERRALESILGDLSPTATVSRHSPPRRRRAAAATSKRLPATAGTRSRISARRPAPPGRSI